MCGIGAVYGYRSDALLVDRKELIAIRDHMQLRGPDGCGAWYSADGRIGLGHRRLAIIDTSSEGLQPMASLDGRIVVVFNGEIYNYRELRHDLQVCGHRFRSQTDTEVLLAGWREWGERLVDHLRGMYAFCIWDEDRRGLFVARDPFGIKPLYVADDGKTLRIASQVKALLAGGGINTTPEPAGHAGFFLWGSVPEPYTLYKGIRAFPPGVAHWFPRDGNRRERQFANVPDLILAAEERSQSWSPAEVQDRLRSAVHDSVEKHLIADVPVGVFLSSGVDSSVLASVASEVSRGPVRTLTLGFQEYRNTQNDETVLAEATARRLNTQHVTRWVSQANFADEFAAFLAAMDQPTLDGLNVWFICKLAQESGCKVALSGLGGDEFFGSYPSFQQIPALVRRLRPLHGIRSSLGRGFRKVTAPWLGHISSPKYAGLLEYGTSEAGAYLLRRSLFMPWELSDCLPSDMVREGLPPLLAALSAQEPNLRLQAKGRVSSLEATLYMRNQLLRDADWASMAHSIELRVPLVDLEVVAAASRADKSMLAQVSPNALPPDIVNRPKTGFIIPVRDWFNPTRTTVGERGLRGWARQVYTQLAAQ
jgi:asparagine synthase (glutamine-hydrolysing)